jgi:hypothetical protein
MDPLREAVRHLFVAVVERKVAIDTNFSEKLFGNEDDREPENPPGDLSYCGKPERAGRKAGGDQDIREGRFLASPFDYSRPFLAFWPSSVNLANRRSRRRRS